MTMTNAQRQAKWRRRRKLLERVNELNMRSDGPRYWTCVVMYNDVIWEHDAGHNTIFEVVSDQR